MTVESMIGRGRDAIDMIVEDGSFHENKIGDWEAPAPWWARRGSAAATWW